MSYEQQPPARCHQPGQCPQRRLLVGGMVQHLLGQHLIERLVIGTLLPRVFVSMAYEIRGGNRRR
ncbi:hypothetical protein [Actinoallomurus vinaceus]|uniref:hypothetical protein n=1 Tax=Actinoallomurus vinaceus TaxID=1080074 RepID=UPI0031EB4389